MSLDWQIVATVVCILLAIVAVLRRVIRLFSTGESGCQTGGCASCPSKGAKGSGPANSGFVPLETLINSSHSINTGPPSRKQ